ncbi:MAG: ArnT family glycosyltransferase [Xenococcaceae cyanobacterium]
MRHQISIYAIAKSKIERHLSDREWIWVIGLFLAAILLFGFNLGNLPIRDWDEGTIAQVAKEIWRSSPDSLNWLFPTLGGKSYFNKPPLIHSLIAVSYHLFGISEWSTRFPVAMLTAGSVPLIYLICRELFPQKSTAHLSAFVYLTLLPVVRHGRLAMLDGALISFFLVLILAVLRSRRDRFALGGISIGLTLICLTKGIMMGLLLAAIAILFLVWDSPKMLADRSFWLAMSIGLTPVLLWYGLQYLHYGGEFINTNLVDQTFSRVWVSVDKKTGAPWFYLLEIFKYTMPWLMFVPGAFVLAWRNRNFSWAKLILVWSGVYFLAISLMTTKLPWYVLPVYPAMAIAIGAYFDLHVQSHNFIYPRIWAILFGSIAVISFAASIYYGFFSPTSELDIQITLVIVALTMTVNTIFLLKNNRYFIIIAIAGLYLGLLFFFKTNNWVWELAEAYPVKPVAELLQKQTLPKQIIYTSYPYNRPSLNFYSDRLVISTSKEDLKNIWLKEKNIYLLVESTLDRELNLNNSKILGVTEEWQLITRDT